MGDDSVKGEQSSGLIQDLVTMKKSIRLVKIKSWQIKDLFTRDLTCSRQKLAVLDSGVEEVVCTVMRLFMCGLEVYLKVACCLLVILTEMDETERFEG